MVAPALMGPYEPLNGTGLVAANPPEAPCQAYSWWVTSDLEVAGFVDLTGLDGQPPVDDPAWRRAHFGGMPAPRFRLVLDGNRARVA
jgi:levansucrase